MTRARGARRAPRAPWRASSGVVVLLAAAFLAAAALPPPQSARDHLWSGTLLLVAILAGLFLVRSGRRERALEQAYHAAVEIAGRLIDSTGRYAENHSRRVAESSVEMARALGCPETEVEDIRLAALLHDLNRLDLPADALALAAGMVPGQLHEVPRAGAGADARGALGQVVRIVACCGERWDGTGRGALAGPDIPLGARIIAVADAYDATVTDRAQRKGRSPAEAIEALQEADGTQFDPQVVEVFIRLRGALADAALAPAA